MADRKPKAHRWQRTGRDGLYRCRDCELEVANMGGAEPSDYPGDECFADEPPASTPVEPRCPPHVFRKVLGSNEVRCVHCAYTETGCALLDARDREGPDPATTFYADVSFPEPERTRIKPKLRGLPAEDRSAPPPQWRFMMAPDGRLTHRVMLLGAVEDHYSLDYAWQVHDSITAPLRAECDEWKRLHGSAVRCREEWRGRCEAAEAEIARVREERDAWEREARACAGTAEAWRQQRNTAIDERDAARADVRRRDLLIARAAVFLSEYALNAREFDPLRVLLSDIAALDSKSSPERAGRSGNGPAEVEDLSHGDGERSPSTRQPGELPGTYSAADVPTTSPAAPGGPQSTPGGAGRGEEP